MGASKLSSLLRVDNFGLDSHEVFVAKSMDSDAVMNIYSNIHSDNKLSTVVTYNVLLNDEDGVTYLEPYVNSVELVAGMSVTFSSKLRHSRTQVEIGTRYVLVGSCAFRSAATPFVALGHKLSAWVPNAEDTEALKLFALSTVGSCFALLLGAGY